MGRGDVRSDIDDTTGILRWLIAGALAGAALLGLFIFVSLVVIALQPPGWVQAALGAALAMGAAIFAWLLAASFGSRKHKERPHLLSSSADGHQTRKRRIA
jgi:hypothetical protein